MMGTHWEQGKKQKNPSLPAPPKEKNWIIHECMLSLLIGCMKLVTIFHLGKWQGQNFGDMVKQLI
jgi:hypothetical protein